MYLGFSEKIIQHEVNVQLINDRIYSHQKNVRCRQDSNLRGETPMDF